MRTQVPKIMSEAIAAGTWRDEGPNLLRQLLGQDLELPDLELFEDIDVMFRVSDQLDDAGYVDDPEFCMVRDEFAFGATGDDRLVFDRALFIAGSTVPGDDVFVALDLHGGESDPRVLVLDWRRPIPHRWVAVGLLSGFIASLSDGCDGQC